ncbi:unnamed protein product [Enterobius vermicularis]|uniref:Tetraspanin n=1 Tax=Enterobius vermicularis TaxID=51028 RepID=A0A0N4V9B6_ENTVE|nr:unnamed protein product [Enterobius vermicularis]
MRRALYAINFLYIVIGVLLISLAAYIRNASIVTSHSLIGGIITVGVFLTLVSFLGIYGTMKHHQYMVILFCVFVVQLGVAVACLGLMSPAGVEAVVTKGWQGSSDSTIKDAQKDFNCCGLRNNSEGINCDKLNCYPSCPSCLSIITQKMYEELTRVGGFGLFFSFLDLAGIAFAMRYRNLRDPKLDPVLYFQQQQ